MAVEAVVFDFGYTLVNEDRVWSAIAGQYGVPTSDFFAVLGAVIERRQDHLATFDILDAKGPVTRVPFAAEDFYEDAIEAVADVRRSGRRVGVAGNFGEDVAAFLRGNLDVDFVASSEAWGVRKPDGAFFARVSEAAQCPPQDVMYVGDRIDNDVVPALSAGMQAVFVVRGPWAHVQKGWLEARGRSATVVHDLRSLFPL